MKLHGMTVPLSSIAVSAPTTVQAGALSATFKLLIVIVINLSVPHQSSVRRAALAGLCNPRFATQLLHLYGFRLCIPKTASCQYNNTSHNGQLMLFDVFLTEGQTGRLVAAVALDLARPGHRRTRRTDRQHRGVHARTKIHKIFRRSKKRPGR